MNRRDEIEQGLAAVRERIEAACSDGGPRAPTRSPWWWSPSSSPPPTSACWPTSASATSGRTATRRPSRRPRECADLDVRWHFIGGLQSNKAAAVATYADVVHSVDRAKLVNGLSRGAQERGRDLDCLVQVSLDPPGATAGRAVTPTTCPTLVDADRGRRRAPTARCDGGRAARRGPRRGLRAAGRDGLRRTHPGAGGDLDLGGDERRSRTCRTSRCDTPPDRLCGPRSEAGRQVMSEAPYPLAGGGTESAPRKRHESRGI